jgi:hypothetical protein
LESSGNWSGLTTNLTATITRYWRFSHVNEIITENWQDWIILTMSLSQPIDFMVNDLSIHLYSSNFSTNFKISVAAQETIFG